MITVHVEKEPVVLGPDTTSETFTFTDAANGGTESATLLKMLTAVNNAWVLQTLTLDVTAGAVVRAIASKFKLENSYSDLYLFVTS